MLQLINEQRRMRTDCGSEGVFEPTDALVFDADLRCAARNHSKDMAERDFFSHENPEGETVYDREIKAGYPAAMAGENIAGGQETPEAVLEAWLGSPGHCANVMSPYFADAAIGYYYAPTSTYRHYWTFDLGTP